MQQKKTAIVAGAGIVSLATARVLSLKGYQVTVIERCTKAVGASIRNFGMVWPIGQPSGELYERALRSKAVWMQVADSTGLWHSPTGSLHAAYFVDEWTVLNELHAAFSAAGRPVELLDKAALVARFASVNPDQLIGGLYSPTEMIVEPRTAIATIAQYLHEFLDVQFIWGKAVTHTQPGKVWSGKEVFQADLVVLCSGADFESLYPELFAETSLTKVKLQMLRFKSRQAGYQLGTSLCGGLSLIHYNSFAEAASLPALRQRYQAQMPEYIANGIHVMVSQNNFGELTVGDSHEYGLTHDPFDNASVNQLITTYLQQLALTQHWELVQTWNGVYPKLQNGDNCFFKEAEPGVFIFNGLGGVGMTMSFGTAEDYLKGL